VSISTYTYNSDGSVKIDLKYDGGGEETSYSIKGNTITKVRSTIMQDYVETLTVNEDGYIIKRRFHADGDGGNTSDGVITYQYKDGNIIQESCLTCGNQSVAEYKYNDKKSPFYNSNTPKWLYETYNTNNVAEARFSGGGFITYTYKYDRDGFPISRTSKFGPNQEDIEIIHYTYCYVPLK
jgi:hypothetical protein